MSAHFKEIASSAMKLPVREQVKLAQQLVSTPDDDFETASVALWFDEVRTSH